MRVLVPYPPLEDAPPIDKRTGQEYSFFKGGALGASGIYTPNTSNVKDEAPPILSGIYTPNTSNVKDRARQIVDEVLNRKKQNEAPPILRKNVKFYEPGEVCEIGVSNQSFNIVAGVKENNKMKQFNFGVWMWHVVFGLVVLPVLTVIIEAVLDKLGYKTYILSKILELM